MRRVEAILAAALALSLTGCVLPGKPKAASVTPVPPKPVSIPTPEPAPGPFSVPQTKVELPPEQPLSAEAIRSTEPPEETPSTPVVRSNKPPRPSRPSGTAAAAVRSEAVAATPPPATVAAPVETERPPIQEILSAAEATRLLNEAVKSRQEINQVVEQLKKHHLSRVEVETKEQAVSLSKLSEQAQKSGDMRKASELAVKGLVLAKALLDGK